MCPAGRKHQQSLSSPYRQKDLAVEYKPAVLSRELPWSFLAMDPGADIEVLLQISMIMSKPLRIGIGGITLTR